MDKPARDLIAAALLLGGLTVTDGRADTAERARYLMGTVCRIEAGHPLPDRAAPAIEAALDEVARWESILSDYDPESELSRLNAGATGGTFTCTRDLFAFLTESLDLSARTGGAFDITVGPLVDLYDLRNGGRWPAASEVRAALARTGWRRLGLDPAARTASFLTAGMRLDPGAIGKGYALDAAASVLRDRRVGWAVLDFGGQILVVGAGPSGCGVPIAIAAAGRSAPAAGRVFLRNASASTSGNDERGRIVDGRELGHILDPGSGAPANRALSVTVVAPTATLADAMSTALFVMGPDEGMRIAGGAGIEAIVTTGRGGGTASRSTPGLDRLTRESCEAAPPPSRVNSP
jgi:thiamine biosynthesis lipoprotein